MRLNDPFDEKEYVEGTWLLCKSCVKYYFADDTDDWTCGYCGGMLVRCER